MRKITLLSGLLCTALTMSVALTGCKKEEFTTNPVINVEPATPVLKNDAKVLVAMSAVNLKGKQVFPTYETTAGTIASDNTITFTGESVSAQVITITAKLSGYNTLSRIVAIPATAKDQVVYIPVTFMMDEVEFDQKEQEVIQKGDAPGEIVPESEESIGTIIEEEPAEKFEAGKDNKFEVAVETGTVIKNVEEVGTAIDKLSFDNRTIDMTTRAVVALSDDEKASLVQEAKDKLNAILTTFSQYKEEVLEVNAYIKEDASKVNFIETTEVITFLQNIAVSVLDSNKNKYDFTIKNVEMNKKTNVKVAIEVDGSITHPNGGDITTK